MYRCLIIVTLILAFHNNINAEIYTSSVVTDFYIQSEYRFDSIDYSEIENYFFREKISIMFSRESSLNIACVYMDREYKKRYTWNLFLNDISPKSTFIIGNYFTNYGSGLLIGRKRYYNPDLFSSRLSTVQRHSFIPCNNGNSIFAFNGIASSYREQISEVTLFLNFFYSIKERFFKEDLTNSGEIAYSLDSLDNKLERSYNHNEPVNIHTHGAMLGIKIMDLLLFQIYYIYTDLRSLSRNEVLWDYEETDESGYGTSRLLGSGFFTQYQDDFFSLFIDGSMTSRERTIEDAGKENVFDNGFLFGLEFKYSFLAISFIGKEVGDEYYSPYSSSIGEDYPEKGWFFDVKVRPLYNLKIGAALSSQRRCSVASGVNELPVTRREKLYLYYSYGILEKQDVTIRMMERVDENDHERRFQVKESMRIGIIKSLKIDLSGIYQRGNKVRASYFFDTGFKIDFLTHLSASCHFSRADISKDNNIYKVISPIRNSSIPGFFIRQDSNIIVLKLDYKYEKIFLSSRYLHQFNNNESINEKFEIFGSGYF